MEIARKTGDVILMLQEDSIVFPLSGEWHDNECFFHYSIASLSSVDPNYTRLSEISKLLRYFLVERYKYVMRSVSASVSSCCGVYP